MDEFPPSKKRVLSSKVGFVDAQSTSKKEQSCTSSKVFLPYVGENFSSDRDFRLLILGESHYGVGEYDENFTTEVVQDLAINRKYKFFTNITQAILDLHNSAPIFVDAKHRFWSGVMFYNFVPGLPVDAARKSPSWNDFQLGKEPFLKVLYKHQPTHVFVCGFRLSEYLKSIFTEQITELVSDENFESYRINGVPCFKSAHPSSGFSSRNTASKFRLFMDRANSAKEFSNWLIEIKR